MRQKNQGPFFFLFLTQQGWLRSKWEPSPAHGKTIHTSGKETRTCGKKAQTSGKKSLHARKKVAYSGFKPGEPDENCYSLRSGSINALDRWNEQWLSWVSLLPSILYTWSSPYLHSNSIMMQRPLKWNLLELYFAPCQTGLFLYWGRVKFKV